MPKLIKNGELVENSWQIYTEAGDDAAFESGNWLLPLENYLNLQEAAHPNMENLGVIVPGDTDVGELAKIPATVPVVAIDFPVFTDGRGFTLGRTLREHCDFTGELRATGNYMLDQLFYLKRCGFSSFAIADEADMQTVNDALSSFSVKYQAAIDEPQPLFRRRS
ncbi:DUF934 domain-containing protein [Teredinibacter turnerae]|uniref:DUF934 domain-containing protein n=1 Tax=Teredinibacter turnerae TaxID=2426 RepID=UPI000362AB2E|nr:DUF934 domain-containing protein [Teredinibacter turnerae]